MSSSNIPHIICISGLDGCGKSTAVRALSKWLEDSYVVHIWDILGDLSEPLFKSKRSIDDYLCSLDANSRLLFLAHALHYSVHKAKNSGKSRWLVNAYYHKYFVAELVLGADPTLVQSLIASFPVPDIVIRLALSPELAAGRKEQLSRYECGLVSVPNVEAFIAFQQKMQNKWPEIQHRGELVVEAKQSPQAVIDEIKKLLGDG